MKTVFGEAGAKGMRWAFLAALFSAVIFIMLASLGANLSNTTFDLALSTQAER